MTPRPIRHARRGFSLIELLIAFTISATLLTATMTALHASFRSYKATTESASTHVVARMVMHRVLSLIRTGDEFGPYPVNPIETPEIQTDWIEFVTLDDEATGERRVLRLESRDAPDGSDAPLELWLVTTTFIDGVQSDEEERTLIEGLTSVTFTLEYDVGPRLRRATFDMTVRPNDLQDAEIGAGMIEAPTIRMVASATPRTGD
ncbi:MAG: prepilin-type N-terminal cleavage/methylation domain-containing protein [Phycisphaerales bacterium]|nr:prepilin-type N-terminal cleavage/methylation domain-containing protein [Phycisphaerales bacterium]